jgi:hypothetical protein
MARRRSNPGMAGGELVLSELCNGPEILCYFSLC